jgi:hypothetical protein
MQQTKQSSPRRRKISASVILAAGFGIIYFVPLTNGKGHDWLDWMTPFAFWSVALLTYVLGVNKNNDAA